MPSENHPVPEGQGLCDHSCEVPSVDKVMETENRELLSRGHRISGWQDEKSSVEMEVVTVAQRE